MRVTLLSLSQIDRDWRVRRHAQLLHDEGHEVRTIGLRGNAAALPWNAAEIELPGWTTVEVATQAARLASVRLRPNRALAVYWSSPRYRALYDATAATGRADLYVANDWNTLPTAARLAREHGTRYAYDTHEYAVEEGADRLRWRLAWPPFLRALEGGLIHDAAWVSTVSDGIADLLRTDYRLSTRPTVIRNVPRFEAMTFRPPQNQYTVLFHGLLVDDRGLEPLIDSVARWLPPYRLVLRGNGAANYVASLRQRVAGLGLSGRVIIEDAVPPDQVVRAAHATADIGIHPMPAGTLHARFGMPNKYFEYTMAGLALCVVAGTELADCVGARHQGVVLPEVNAHSIAHVINALDANSIAKYKRSSLDAAKELCWEREAPRLRALYAEADTSL